MKIAVMNLQFGVGTTRGYWQYLTTAWKYSLPHSMKPMEQAAAILRNRSIDIALCTEVSAKSLRSNFKSQPEFLRLLSGIAYARFFPCTTSPLWDEGNCILTRYEILETRLHPLPGGIVPRTLGEILLNTSEGIITVFIVHLALGKRARERQIRELSRIVAAKAGPVILGGDFNARTLKSLIRIADGNFTHVCPPTFPSWHPKYALQSLFVNREFHTNESEAPGQERFSDHLPLIAEISLKDYSTQTTLRERLDVVRTGIRETETYIPALPAA